MKGDPTRKYIQHAQHELGCPVCYRRWDAAGKAVLADLDAAGHDDWIRDAFQSPQQQEQGTHASQQADETAAGKFCSYCGKGPKKKILRGWCPACYRRWQKAGSPVDANSEPVLPPSRVTREARLEDVAELLADGQTLEGIAARLRISLSTALSYYWKVKRGMEPEDQIRARISRTGEDYATAKRAFKRTQQKQETPEEGSSP